MTDPPSPEAAAEARSAWPDLFRGPWGWAIALSIAAGAALRLWQLGRTNFWLDEAASVTIARLEWASFWKLVLTTEINNVFYHLLLRGWMLAVQSETGVRAFSAICGIVTLLLFAKLAARLFDQRVAVAATVLLALSPFHIHYSQEARSYSLMGLMVVLASLVFVKCLERPTLGHWLAYALTIGLAFYTHVYAILALGAHLLALVLFPGRLPARPVLVGLVTALVLVLPGLIVLSRSNVGQLSWVPEFTWNWFLRQGQALAGGKVLLVFFAAAAVVAAIHVARVAGRLPLEAWRVSFLLLWLTAPIAALLVISLRQPTLVSRYMMSCLFPMILLAAWSLARLPGNATLFLSVAVLGALSWLSGPLQPGRPLHDWRGAVDFVLRESRPDDALIFPDRLDRLPFEVQAERKSPGFVARQAIFPQHPSWRDPTFRPPQTFSLGLLDGSTRPARIWEVGPPSGRSRHVELIHAHLRLRYRSGNPRDFSGRCVILWEALAPTGGPAPAEKTAPAPR